MADDACTKKVKATGIKWPSARASQQLAKCRKSKGQVRKTEKGKSLRRWGKEKWKDTRTGKPCGQGGKTETCRPSKVVSKKKTPKTRYTDKEQQDALFAKRAGKRAPSVKRPRRK
jgi:hypothetical protein